MLYYLVWYWYFTLSGLSVLVFIFFAIQRKFKLALIAILLGIIFGGVGWAITYKDQHRYVKEYKQLTRKLDYTVYKPRYKIPEAREASVGIDHNQNDSSHPYVFFTYRKGKQAYYTIYQYNVDSFIAKFPNCGPTVPEPLIVRGEAGRKCQQISTTSNGLTVYKEMPEPPFTGAYATSGNTRIVVAGLGDEQTLLRVFESFEATNPSELPFINRD